MFSTMKTSANKTQMINLLKNSGALVSKDIIKAFEKVDRVDFIPEKPRVFCKHPKTIGHGQTNSQPLTVAIMLEFLKPLRGDRILDVGTGSGWTTALLAHTVGEKGEVYGVEVIADLVKFGQRNLKKYKFNNASILEAGDVLGFPTEAPFDKILVSAAAPKLPKVLVRQLKVGGRMVIPVQNSIWVVNKVSNNTTKIRKHYGFSFVPLVE